MLCLHQATIYFLNCVAIANSSLMMNTLFPNVGQDSNILISRTSFLSMLSFLKHSSIANTDFVYNNSKFFLSHLDINI